MVYVEQVNGGEVVSLQDGNIEGIHNPCCCHAKVISDHHDSLQVATVALP